MENNKKKISPMHIFRRLMQITFFIFLPGIFTSAFYAIKEVYQAILSGSASFGSFSGSLLILFGTVILTMFLGRFFCGFACSFGAMSDLLWFISKKTIKPKFRPSEKLDATLKYLKYGILIFIFFGLWTFELVTIDSMSSPWTIFGMFSSIGNFASAKYLLTIGGLLLLLIMIGSLLIERFFCRYLCPLGAVFAIVSKVRFFHIRKNRDKCGSCRICTKSCSMGIPLYKYDKVTSGECINCFACVENCPRKNVKANPAPAVASAVSVVAISGLVYAGTVVSTSASQNLTGSGTTTASTVKGTYTDGTYTGTGNGFRGETEVSVTVENGNITDITVVSYQDDQEYFSRAENTIISEILEAQDTDVDTVSGATFSSKGIIAAVSDALAGTNTTDSSDSGATTDSADASESSETQTTASNSSASDSSTSDSSTTDSSETQSGTTDSGTTTQALTDGTYTGTGTGFRGETEVSVTVTDGKISDITIESYQDDEQFFSRAESTVISEIIQDQDVNVDAVSGATFSSNGIKEAVANALGISFTNPNDSASGQQGHGGKGFR